MDEEEIIYDAESLDDFYEQRKSVSKGENESIKRIKRVVANEEEILAQTCVHRNKFEEKKDEKRERRSEEREGGFGVQCLPDTKKVVSSDNLVFSVYPTPKENNGEKSIDEKNDLEEKNYRTPNDDFGVQCLPDTKNPLLTAFLVYVQNCTYTKNIDIDNICGVGQLPYTKVVHFAFFNEIKEILEGKKVIKATLLVFLLEHNVIYLRLLNRLFETLSPGSLEYYFDDLVKKHLIFKIENGSSLYKKEIKEFKNVLKFKSIKTNNNRDRIVWYAFTDEAKEILPLFKNILLEIIPENTQEKIKDNSFQSLFKQTHDQLRKQQLDELREKNLKIKEITGQISLNRYGDKNHTQSVNKELTQAYKATHKDRLSIAERMLEESKEGEV